MPPTHPEPITLYFKEGTSDKVYQVSIEAHPGRLFTCNFAYGRRGSTMTCGSKTPAPVPLETVLKAFDKAVKEKMAKGYTEGESGVPYASTPKAERVTGNLPQLLNDIPEAMALALLKDPRYCLQEKHDGRRIMIERDGDQVVANNRKGLTVPIPEPVRQAVLSLRWPFADPTFLLDGEMVGEVFHAFDLLQWNRQDFRGLGCCERHTLLVEMLGITERPALVVVESHTDTAAKIAAYNLIKAANGEGVVFKLNSSPYVPDRPSTGGDQLKYKFCATASFIVTGGNGSKRSVCLALYNDALNLVRVGNVTIPPNKAVPNACDIVDVKYLYAFKGGCIFQPVYLGPRDDIEEADCTLGQLKYKAEPLT